MTQLQHAAERGWGILFVHSSIARHGYLDVCESGVSEQRDGGPEPVAGGHEQAGGAHGGD